MLNKVNELQLHELTGRARGTVKKRVDGLPFEVGERGQKLYNSRDALERIMEVTDSDGKTINAAEASRLLTIARKEQINLEMEVTRKERVPIEDVSELLDATFANVGGLLKAHRGKTLTDQVIEDIFTELRDAGNVLGPVNA